MVDVVDEHDRVVRTATRSEMRAGRLRHRAVYIAVRTSAGDVVVHRRAPWKDVFPHAWDCAFGGVLGSGEDWVAAARRELREEAGVDAPLVELGAGTYTGPDCAVVGRVFEAVHDGPYPCADGEVVEVRTVPLADLPAFLAGHPHCPDSAELVLPLLG